MIQNGTDYDWLHYGVKHIRSYALTAPMHLDTVHTTLSTELQNARKMNTMHSIQYDLATGRSQKRSLMSTMHQKLTNYNINS